MKYLVFFSIIFIYSCKKDNTNSSLSSRPYLSSIKYSSAGTLVVDSFVYNPDMRLVNFVQHKYDSNGISVIHGRLEAFFQYNTSESVPHSYVYTGSQIENHSLTFDSQNRIIKDTSLNGTHNVVYYAYSAVGMSSMFLFGGNFLQRQLDSLFISKENMDEETFYYSNGNPIAEFSGSLQQEYSSFTNPTYQPGIISTIGPLLHILTYDGYGGFNDFISKNLFNKMVFLDDTNTTVEGNGNWNTDTNGNVVNGTITGPIQAYIEFSYY
jgi:hypothetical protein